MKGNSLFCLQISFLCKTGLQSTNPLWPFRVVTPQNAIRVHSWSKASLLNNYSDFYCISCHRNTELQNMLAPVY